MFNVAILAVGRLKESWLREGLAQKPNPFAKLKDLKGLRKV